MIRFCFVAVMVACGGGGSPQPDDALLAADAAIDAVTACSTPGECPCFSNEDCPAGTRDGVVDILKRSVWTRWTGQNLVWGVGNQIVRGLITGDASLVVGAYERMYQEIVVTPKEGIQADFSFHQHGDQFYSGGYGLGFANDVGRYVALRFALALAS